MSCEVCRQRDGPRWARLLRKLLNRVGFHLVAKFLLDE